MSGWTLSGLVGAICSLVIWEWVALVQLALQVQVWTPICWIPAVATSGVMLAATAMHMTPELAPSIRRYAGWLSAVGIVGGILGTGTSHYLDAAHITPSPWMALPVGGIPVLMGGLLVHLLSMVFAQKRGEQAAAAVADVARQARMDADRRAEAERQDRIRAEEDGHRRDVARQRELADAAKTAANETARQATEAERLKAATELRAEIAQRALSATTTRPRLVVNNVPNGSSSRPGEWQARAEAWLRSQADAGRDWQSIGPAEISRAIDAKPGTCKSSHQRWKASVAAELQLRAELAEAAG
ncbi:MAG: hypothetical protein ACRDTT_03030 [Pseudonocardiaceae bacterium]